MASKLSSRSAVILGLRKVDGESGASDMVDGSIESVFGGLITLNSAPWSA